MSDWPRTVDALKFTDDFDGDTRDKYDFITGFGSAADFSVASGELVLGTPGGGQRFLPKDLPPYADVMARMRFKPAVANSGTYGFILAWLDNSNYLLLRTGSTSTIFKVDGGTATTLGSGSGGTTAAGTYYWVVAYKIGNFVRVELHNDSGGGVYTLITAADALLSGADATKFGSGVLGRHGFFLSANTNDVLDKFALGPSVW